MALIKRHITNNTHPIHRIVRAFKKKFYKENMYLLGKYNEEDTLAFPDN
jgi:hypothetical protein